MNKLTQAEIDELAKDSDEEQQPQYQQEFQQNAVEEEYPQDEEMNEEMNEEIASEQPEEQYKIEDEPEVQSEIASENMDEFMSEQIGNSDFQFKKDQDLSEAQSEFIESSRLNDGAILKIKSNMKSQASKQIIKPKPNQNKKPKTADPIQKPKVIKKPLPKTATVKKPQKGKVEEQSKREKLSESEIARRMKDIQESKRQMQRKKEERSKKDEQARRKEYEQAKQKQEEKKQKNKRIFEEQLKAKKKPVSATPSVKAEEEEQVKIPEKRSDFKYMEQKKQRVMNEKQIQKQIQQQNIQKLKRLNENQPREPKGQVKKQAILDERNYQLQRQKKEKQKEGREEDVLIIKQIKQEIMECKRFNLEKNQQINRAQKNIEILNKKVKQKQKIFYDVDSKADANKKEPVYEDLSELSPVEKFVHAFPQSKTVDEIFSMIDSNGDGVLSTAEIHEKLSQFGLSKEIIDRVQEVLDENNDGTVSRQQFVFLIQLQTKRQKDYRQILGDITVANPLDLQARIVDMQAKLKYINKQLDLHRNSNEDEAYQTKIDALSRKAGKIESKIRKEMTDLVHQGRGELPVNSIAHLTNEYVRLRNDRTIRSNFLQKLRKRVKQNLAEKNKLLSNRVQEGLRLQEELYKIKNDIQERELRFLSMKKIEENKRGYVERQTQKRKEMEEAYKRTKQYEVLIADPSKKAQNNALAEEMKFLAAVLMIQRNYRKKKARREFQRLKQEAK